jgi:hypothetical protein
MSVRITSPSQSVVRDCLLDSGADDTVFPEKLAAVLGIDLAHLPQLTINLAGRAPVLCRYAAVELRITDGVQKTYEWTATVGFAPVWLQYPLLGHAGFLQYIDAHLRGADHEAILAPNWAFTGRRI